MSELVAPVCGAVDVDGGDGRRLLQDRQCVPRINRPVNIHETPSFSLTTPVWHDDVGCNEAQCAVERVGPVHVRTGNVKDISALLEREIEREIVA